MITLEISICDQRRSYIADFANGSQAVAFMERRTAEDKAAGYAYGNHAYSEMEEFPIAPNVGPVTPDIIALLDYLYPQCEHQMSAALCMGPDHFMSYDQERALYG